MWTIKFKTLTVSIKYTSHSRDPLRSQIMCRGQFGNLILRNWHRAPWWLVSLSNKSNRPSYLSLLGRRTQIHGWRMARWAQENNPEYILYINTQQIRDLWDLQKQSTFQCILITTQWLRLKNWRHKLTSCDSGDSLKATLCFFFLRVSGIGGDSSVREDKSYPCGKVALYWRLSLEVVEDNHKRSELAGPIPRKSQAWKSEILHPNTVFFFSIKRPPL